MFHLDFDSALVEGLSDDLSVSSEDSPTPDLSAAFDPVDRPPVSEELEPGIDLEFEIALMEGLSDSPDTSPDDTGPPGLPGDVAPASAPGKPVSTPDDPAEGIDAEFASALIEGLTDSPDTSPDNTGPAGLPGDVAPAPAPGKPVSMPDDPAEGIDAEFASALIEGLTDSPDTSPDNTGPAGLPGDVAPAPAPGKPVSMPDDPAEGIDAEFASALIEGLTDSPDTSPDNTGPAGLPGDVAPAPAPGKPVSMPEDPAEGIDAEFASALLEGFADGPGVSSEEPTRSELGVSFVAPVALEVLVAGPDSSVAQIDVEFADALVEGLADIASVSSEGSEARDLPEADAAAADLGDMAAEFAVLHAAVEIPVTDFDADAGEGLAAGTRDAPVAALAFATDPETEGALREGLLYYEAPLPGYDDAQVWPGGLRAAVAALAEGHSTRLVIVDIDGVPYPAGAMHELAEVCEIGTVVIAIGSDDSARLSREILLSGVSDYLVKPITPAAVREVTARVTSSNRDNPVEGCVAGFAGTGGSGATTLAVATALLAAELGRYVSLLDLNRTVPATAVSLDVEPAPGLDQLFEIAGKRPADPQMLDGVCSQRSERVSVYSYRWNQSPPPAPSMPALDWLLGELRHRSQLVLVDGVDDPQMHFALLAQLDTRVLVAEPTVGGATRAARVLDVLGAGPSTLLVQNHTRSFRVEAGTRLLLEAGIERPPDVVVPFEQSLPEIVDRGWPQGRAPRRLRKPLADLASRIFLPDLGWRSASPERRQEP